MILIVDDKPENIYALRKLLEVNNFNVDSALSGEDALKKVLKNNYALIILDVQMPGMDGFEVAEAISGLSKGKDIPIIFLSAVNTDKKFITKGYSSGGIDYVTKPVDPDIMLLKVNTFHRLYEQARELREVQLALRHEVVARTKAQYEQHSKTEELRSILESIPQVAFTANAAGDIEYVNEQWYTYSPDKNIFPEVYDKDIVVSGYWQKTIAAPPVLPVEVCISKLHSKDCRYHALSLVPVKEEDAIVKWVGTFTDIHEQKLATEILEKKVEERTSKLMTANKELAFQNDEKEKRAAELVVANKELLFQNDEKEKRAAELVIANNELVFQNNEKEKRAAELVIANRELVFQNHEKEKRAAELIIANKELAFQNEEKGKRAVELIGANRLYAFISQINQSILHSQNEQRVFEEACRIAIDYGKFQIAAISIVDQATQKTYLAESRNILPEDLHLFNNVPCNEFDPTTRVLRTGEPFICNDIENEVESTNWRSYAAKRGLNAFMILPVRKAGDVVGTFNLYASDKNCFDRQEVLLLEEAAGDISFALDIFGKETHRKEMEGRVIHNELRLKQAQAIAHIGSWEKDIATGVEFWSEELCRIYGIPHNDNNQSVGTWLSFIHPADLNYVKKTIKQSRADVVDCSFYHRIKRKDETIRYIYSQIHFVVNETGKPISKYGVVHDITETNDAKEAWAESEANLRLIMDSIPQLISTRTISGKFLFVNKSFSDFFGKTPEQLSGTSLARAFTVKSEADYYLQQDKEVIVSGKMKTDPENSFTDYNGNKRLFYTLKVPFTAAGTSEITVLDITTEITGQKKADEERTKMVADIVQRNKELEQFSYIVSHNLRAPLANIIGLTTVMQFQSVSPGDRTQLVTDLTLCATKLDDVIKDLNKVLQVKNETSGKNEAVKFADLLADIELSIDNLIKNEKVLIRSNFSAISGMWTVKSYMHSIFFNLISNSIKYRQHHLDPVIKIESYRIGNKFRIIFKDNGLGIDLAKRGDQVFGLYKRFHIHTEGKGMGLYMVKTQVESLGGTISVTSNVDQGTEFLIEFEAN